MPLLNTITHPITAWRLKRQYTKMSRLQAALETRQDRLGIIFNHTELRLAIIEIDKIKANIYLEIRRNKIY